MPKLCSGHTIQQNRIFVIHKHFVFLPPFNTPPSLFLYPTLSLSHSISLSLSYFISLSLCPSFSLSLSYFISLSLCPSFSLSLFYFISFSLCLSPPLSFNFRLYSLFILSLSRFLSISPSLILLCPFVSVMFVLSLHSLQFNICFVYVTKIHLYTQSVSINKQHGAQCSSLFSCLHLSLGLILSISFFSLSLICRSL